ncbi:MAG: hypothetical protein MRY83_24815 [Flavobacteriales bacterium]|nr:hypothetical protein [Flavobacteriales bacterium]
MKLLKKKDLKQIISKKGDINASLFIPTHRDGSDINRIQFSSILKELKSKIITVLEEDEAKKFLRPFYELEKNTSFWKYQSDGLAIFANKNYFEPLALPINFEPFTYVSDHFYVKSILPVLNEDDDFYMLIANKSKIQPFLCSRYWIEEIDIEEEIQTIGNFSEFQITRNKGAVQGHSIGSGSLIHKQNPKLDKSNRALTNYVNEWMKALETKIDNEIPVLLVADDRMMSVVRSSKTKLSFFDKEIRGNYAKENILLLHEMAVKKLQDFFNEKKVKYIEGQELKDPKDLIDVYEASKDGRVSAIGVQNLSNEMVQIKEDKDRVFDVCMLNLSVINTIRNGGDAFLIDQDHQDEKMTAIYRY